MTNQTLEPVSSRKPRPARPTVIVYSRSAVRPKGTQAIQLQHAHRNTWLAIGLIVLGLGSAAIAILGPLVTGVIRYHFSEAAMNQIRGGDVAGLALMAPLSVIAGILVWRGSGGGQILALGPAAYALYLCAQLAVGGDVTR